MTRRTLTSIALVALALAGCADVNPSTSAASAAVAFRATAPEILATTPGLTTTAPASGFLFDRDTVEAVLADGDLVTFHPAIDEDGAFAVGIGSGWEPVVLGEALAESLPPVTGDDDALVAEARRGLDAEGAAHIISPTAAHTLVGDWTGVADAADAAAMFTAETPIQVVTYPASTVRRVLAAEAADLVVLVARNAAGDFTLVLGGHDGQILDPAAHSATAPTTVASGEVGALTQGLTDLSATYADIGNICGWMGQCWERDWCPPCPKKKKDPEEE